MSLEAKIDALKKDLLNPAGPSISTNRNYPFALFQYLPHEEFSMRSNLADLLAALRNKGWTILNVDLFSTFIECLSEEEDGDLIEALIEEEKLQYKAHKNDYKMPISVLQNSLDVLSPPADRAECPILRRDEAYPQDRGPLARCRRSDRRVSSVSALRRDSQGGQ